MPHKKNHSWKDLAGEAGSTFKKGALYVKKKWQSDANPIQGQLNKSANIANTGSGKRTAAGSIQEKLVKAGHSKSDLRRLGEKNKASQANRKQMDQLRKTNPEEYKKRKKKQRKAEMAKSFTARSSTWD